MAVNYGSFIFSSSLLFLQMFPLTHQEQLLLVEVQESIGERHLFQLRKEEASRFFNKALRTLEHIMEEESYDNVRPLLESKGIELVSFIDCIYVSTRGPMVCWMEVILGNSLKSH